MDFGISFIDFPMLPHLKNVISIDSRSYLGMLGKEKDTNFAMNHK